LIAGGAGAKLSAARFAPRLADKYMERWTFESQKTNTPASPGRPDNLYSPVANDGGERGHNWRGHTRGSSVYTKAMLHPAAAAGIAAATVALAGAVWRYAGLSRRSGTPAARAAAKAEQLEFGLS
jgi:hypothetical protein